MASSGGSVSFVVKKEFNEKLPTVRPLRDIVWGILFSAQLLVIIILAIVKLSDVDWDAVADVLGSDELGKFWGLLGAVAGTMFVFGWLWRLFMKSMAGQLIVWSIAIWSGMMLFFIIVNLGELQFGPFYGSSGVAVPLIIFTILYLMYLWFQRGKIPFAEAILTNTNIANSEYYGPFYFAAVFQLFQIGYSFFFMITMIIVIAESDGIGDGTFWLIFLSYYWGSSYFSTTTHYIAAYTAAVWCFGGDSSDAPTWNGVIAGFTSSFGTICVGALLIAIFRATRAWFNFFCCNCSGCNPCARACLNCIDKIIDRYKEYVLSEAALYGGSFWNSAGQLTDVFKATGFDGITTDVASDIPLRIGRILGFFLSYVMGYGLSKHLWDGISTGGAWFFGLLCGWFGLMVIGITLNVISSTIATIFVCWAEDARAFKEHRPTEYQAIESALMSSQDIQMNPRVGGYMRFINGEQPVSPQQQPMASNPDQMGAV